MSVGQFLLTIIGSAVGAFVAQLGFRNYSDWRKRRASSKLFTVEFRDSPFQDTPNGPRYTPAIILHNHSDVCQVFRFKVQFDAADGHTRPRILDMPSAGHPRDLEVGSGQASSLSLSAFTVFQTLSAPTFERVFCAVANHGNHNLPREQLFRLNERLAEFYDRCRA